MIILSRPEATFRFFEDMELIRKVLNEKGYNASDADIEWAWKMHSEDFAAQWLFVHGKSDEEIFEAITDRLTEKES